MDENFSIGRGLDGIISGSVIRVRMRVDDVGDPKIVLADFL